MKATFFMAILFVTITSSAAIPAEKAGDPAAKAPVPAPSKTNPPSQKGIPPPQKGSPPAQNVVTPPAQNSTLPGGSIWGCDDAKVKGVVFSFRGCEVEYEVTDAPKKGDCPSKKVRRCCNMKASMAVSYGGNCIPAAKQT
ncbi:uncharacterized protein PGTG_03113 [Puccinia graminis f. sp. tritici CRL 75-36-700-3]|uniref:Uncharacterized protein n=1 Tax=Puccinia graminis f. sp. tritici (strain CRL 75-36-700-3 / race SCCL) TaxID=418459 RepID=E3JYN2_PUCGT|nr:uncharacterized protein PGTG_03113 [Puccinia graminis f. sp. tritici CRL 75-36-700-3]EFP77157.2 hypothetical protein PGTG_03113 [Puccinia graminis f. sp. tritici CRL 75-36-700-3]